MNSVLTYIWGDWKEIKIRDEVFVGNMRFRKNSIRRTCKISKNFKKSFSF